MSKSIKLDFKLTEWSDPVKGDDEVLLREVSFEGSAFDSISVWQRMQAHKGGFTTKELAAFQKIVEALEEMRHP